MLTRSIHGRNDIFHITEGVIDLIYDEHINATASDRKEAKDVPGDLG